MLAVCFLIGGHLPPAVNESHYLLKARHFWQPDYLAHDFFISSSNAHWFFYVCVGWLGLFVSNASMAWIGRVGCWILLCISWRRLTGNFSSHWYRGSLSWAVFLTLLNMGSFSGEWVVGGVESKCFAYAFVFLAVDALVRFEGEAIRANLKWIYLGIASAFHVLTGGWFVLTFLLVAATRVRTPSPDFGGRPSTNGWLRANVLGLFMGGLVSLIGLFPALAMDIGQPATETREAHLIQVYSRLAHHLSPLRYEPIRWYGHASLLVAAIVILKVTLQNGAANDRTDTMNGNRPTEALAAVRVVQNVALAAFAITCVGILIDALVPYMSWNVAAGLLRFYWFRINDVTWPIVIALAMMTWRFNHAGAATNRMKLFLACSMTVVCLAFLIQNFQAKTTFASHLGEKSVRKILYTGETSHSLELDWLAACNWIRTNTDSDAVFLTPRMQQNFKWYAERAEIYCFKDCPQDAQGILDWHQRRYDTALVGNRKLSKTEMTNILSDLTSRYRVDYWIVDLRWQQTAPDLPRIYPGNEEENPSYAVYQIPSVLH